MASKEFKKGIDVPEARGRRTDQSVSIRNNKRQQRFAKNRHLDLDDELAKEEPGMRKLIRNIQSQDPHIRLESVIGIRKLLSGADNGAITDEFIRTGSLSTFVQYLGVDDDPKLQFESAWVLTCLSSGTSDVTGRVINSGAIPGLVALLSSKNDDLREQALWALGNIAGDSPLFRDYVLQAGALQPLLHCFKSSKIGLLRNAAWSLSNFCRGKPPPPFHYLQPTIPVLNTLLQTPDDEVLTDVCWALSYLTDGTDERIQVVVNEREIIPRVVELLDHETPSVQTPALRVIGNIVTGDENQTQAVMQCPMALPHLKRLLFHRSNSICKETCWALSNMAAGTQQQIQSVIDSRIFGDFDALIQRESSEISKEILQVLANAAEGGTINQVIMERDGFFFFVLFQGTSSQSLTFFLKNSWRRYFSKMLLF